MPLNGDVTTFPLAAIVQMIHDERKTGILTVSTPRHRCSIYFRGGKIIHVRGNTDKELKLGALLKANNLISEERLEDMLAVSKAMEKRLGTVLLEREYIDRDKLVSIIHLQFKETVATMLSWDDAQFSYSDGLDGYSDEIKCEVDPVRLALEAKKREEFKGLIPNDQVIFLINQKVDTSKSVHAARDLRVLLLLDGRRTVAQLIKETGYSRLAVYRSLAKLYAQNGIVRKGDDRQPTKRMDTLELGPITSLYWSLLQMIITDLAEEIGASKASSSLENSLRHSAYYERFLKPLQLDQDLATNIDKMQTLVQQQGRPLSQNDFINGFNQVLVSLLGEQYQFLGYKGTTNTVKRMRASLQNVPDNHRPLAQAISRLLENYEREDFLRGTRHGDSTQAGAASAIPEGRRPQPTMNNMSGTAIVNFYNDMFRLVISDLEQEVGAKARGLFQGLIRSSHYSDTLLAHFEVQDISDPNPLRLKNNVEAGELTLGGQDLVQTFQQVLRGLLLEENRLLGPKATDLTVSRLAERMNASHTQFKPLLDELTATVVRKPAKTGS
ncbi:MAG: DUF4388 domain-containing protein [Deltaproteobacteria bacterium]|nr:MAG: DUF4388 domain-containing protein [Deltaproteobacteria bacterium]